MDSLYHFINEINPLSQESWNELSKMIRLKKHPVNSILCKIGSIPTKLYFLKSGIIRAFTISSKGDEYNNAIFTPFYILGSFTALIKKCPSKIAYECLTKCEVIEANYYDLIALVDKRDDLRQFYRKTLENIFIGYEKRDLEIVTLNATERYLNLRKRIPNIDNLISQYHIASHLGITPIQLSRIRKKLSLEA